MAIYGGNHRVIQFPNNLFKYNSQTILHKVGDIPGAEVDEDVCKEKKVDASLEMLPESFGVDLINIKTEAILKTVRKGSKTH